jgi:hypothetical protein
MEIGYSWVSTDFERGKLLILSKDKTALVAPQGMVNSLSQASAIYRWGFFKGGQLWEAYVGETENLRQRIRGYLNPGPTQATNKRMNVLFCEAIDDGFEVRLEILKIEPVRINQLDVCNQNLANPFLRKMMENLVLADFDVVKHTLHNSCVNRIERRRQRALKNNPYLDTLRSLGVNVD